MLNFRDIAAQSGGRLRPGQVWRSGNPETEADAATLRRLGILHRHDLRSAPEAMAHRAVVLESRAQPHRVDTGLPMRALGDPGATPHSVRAAMIALYRGLAVTFAPVLRQLLQDLANHPAPALIHCAVGKDRTGVGVATLLAALDLPEALILEDYLASNAALPEIEASILRRYPAAQAVSAALLRPIVQVDGDYLRAYLAACGPMRDWLAAGPGLSAADLDRLRARLL